MSSAAEKFLQELKWEGGAQLILTQQLEDNTGFPVAHSDEEHSYIRAGLQHTLSRCVLVMAAPHVQH